jgi:hypothetical protein
MSVTSFTLHSAGVVAPGIESLDALRMSVRAGVCRAVDAPMQLPPLQMLPPTERRRSSPAIHLALACIEQALRTSQFSGENLRSVFATDEGTGIVLSRMMEAIATTRQVSPLVFPNSLLHAPAGYFSIGWHNRRPSNAVSQGLDSFAAGLLCALGEALACREPVLLVSFDPVVPEPFDECLPIHVASGAAMVLSAGDRHAGLARFELSLERAHCPQAQPLPSWMPASWAARSSARALALLGMLEEDEPLRLSLGAQSLTVRMNDRGGT